MSIQRREVQCTVHRAELAAERRSGAESCEWRTEGVARRAASAVRRAPLESDRLKVRVVREYLAISSPSPLL